MRAPRACRERPYAAAELGPLLACPERQSDVPSVDLYHAPQDPHGTGLRFETGERGGEYPDNMPQAITMTDAQGRWAVYVPLLVGGKIVVPELPAHCG